MATNASSRFFPLDERSRGLIFEMTAVTAWLLLPQVLRFNPSSTLERLGEEHDPAGWRYLSSIALHVGQIATLIYIMWNSGDRLARFGLTEPRRRDFVAGFGFVFVMAALAFSIRLTPWAGHAVLRASLPHAPSNTIEPRHVFDLVNGCLRNAIGVLAFVGIIYSRLEELTGSWIGAAVSATVMFCFWYGWDAGVPATVYGLVAGAIFVTFRRRMISFTPALIYLVSLCLILMLGLFPQ